MPGTYNFFTFQFSAPNSWQDLGVVNVLVNRFLDGRNACYIAYSLPSNMLYLVNDAGDGLLPGIALNGSGSLSNSQCTIDGGGSHASGSGNVLTLTLDITFRPGFAGERVFYVAARDDNAGNSGWQTMGSWRIEGATPATPSVRAIDPGRADRQSQTLTFTFTDTAGAGDLGIVNVLINPFLDGRHACYLAYSRPNHMLYMVNDAGDGLILLGIALNGAGTLANSQCTVTGAGSSVVVNGNDLTLTLNLALGESYCRKNHVIWAAARSLAEATTGWQPVGTWGIR